VASVTQQSRQRVPQLSIFKLVNLLPVTVLASARSDDCEPRSVLLITTVLTPVSNSRLMASFADDKSVIFNPVNSLHSHMTTSLGNDTIEEFNVDSKAECDQLNLAHKTKTSKRQCPLSSVQVKIHEGSPEGIRRLWGKDL